MSILVTESAGHLGEALIRSLRAEGRSATGVGTKPSPYTDRVGSICDRPFIDDCMKRAQAVIHAATLHKPHVATHSWREFMDTNVTGTLALLEAAISTGVQSFVYISTTSAFGSSLSRTASAPAIWVTEKLVSGPRNIYGVTKKTRHICGAADNEIHSAVIQLARQLPLTTGRSGRFRA